MLKYSFPIRGIRAAYTGPACRDWISGLHFGWASVHRSFHGAVAWRTETAPGRPGMQPAWTMPEASSLRRMAGAGPGSAGLAHACLHRRRAAMRCSQNRLGRRYMDVSWNARFSNLKCQRTFAVLYKACLCRRFIPLARMAFAGTVPV